MSILPRLTLCAVLAASIAGCVVAPPPQPRPLAPVPAVDPYQAARGRFDQVQGRIAEEFHRIDVRQQEGYMDPYRADGLRDRLRRIRQEANDMAGQHGGGLSHDEQHVLNEELISAARDIGR